MKKHLILVLLVLVALFCILMGFLYIYSLKSDATVDSTMVAAWFSLAGVMLFAAALIYQIKEFKLQREELIKSVEAQTNTSNALEEQKNIMLEQKQIALEQKTDAFLMSIIEGYNKFKGFTTIQRPINELISDLNDRDFARAFTSNGSVERTFTMLAENLLAIAEPHLLSPSNKPFLNFSWNMLKKIEESTRNYRDMDDFFRVYFHNHLNDKETVLLLFSELLCLNATLEKKAFFNIPTVQKLIDFLPSTNILIQRPNATKELYDSFANSERVKDKILMF